MLSYFRVIPMFSRQAFRPRHGVAPLLSPPLRSQPSSSRSRTAAGWPPAEARCNGLEPCAVVFPSLVNKVQWIGLRENWNRKAPYLMGKYPWFPVKIFPTKPIHGLWRDLTSWPKPGCLWWMLGEWSQPISQYDHALSWWMYRRTITSNDPNKKIAWNIRLANEFMPGSMDSSKNTGWKSL